MSLFFRGLKKLTKEALKPKNIKLVENEALKITKAKFHDDAKKRLIRSKYALLRTVGKQL